MVVAAVVIAIEAVANLPEKKFETSTGLESTASALAL